jgi:4-alpha-glucanotransferase
VTATRPGVRTLARLYGVETSYEGMDGGQYDADEEALLLTLRALGAPLGSGSGSARAALRARRAELDELHIQPVHVAWDGSLPELRIRLHDAAAQRVSLELRLEAGDVIVQQCDALPVARPARAGWTATHAVRIDRRVPIGYHTAQLETAGATFTTLIIAAPQRAWSPVGVREWGVFFPLYAIASGDGWGVGDYSDLGRIARWVGGLGGGFISTLPLLATFLDAPFEPSPYSPASRLFWSELFIDVPAVPGWTGDGTALAAEIAACRAGTVVDYRRTAALKRRELQRAQAHAAQDTVVRAALAQYTAAHPRVDDYARFRAVCDRRRTGWREWPQRLRDGTIRDGDYAPEDFEYHRFAQWQADQQLGAAAGPSGTDAAVLYLDMPLGANPASYDSWRFRDIFADGVSAGAPPDPLFTGGQDWGFQPPVPQAMRTTGYRYLIETFRHHLRHARMLRLDHVMSLYRLFWVPRGLDAKRGVYVRYPEDELFAVLVLESARHQAVVIGEDLGTVPPAVRRAMTRHGVQRMHVVQFEADPDRNPPVLAPPAPVVASLNTHDMPTFAGFWRGSEIDDQLDLGLIDEDGHCTALERRALLRLKLSRLLGASGEIDVALARQRLLERLSASEARYVLINLEDMWLEPQPQNVPGTSVERPNWQRRASRSLTEIMEDAAVSRMLKSIGERRKAPPTRTMSHG